MAQLGEACAECDRDPTEIEVTAMWFPNPSDLGDVERYQEMGVRRLVVPLQVLGRGNPAENLQRFAENVLPQIG